MNNEAIKNSKLLTIRLAIVNFSPAIKRFFYWQPEMYFLLSLVALLATIRGAINKQRTVIAFVALSWLWLTISPDKVFFQYLPAFIVWVFALAQPYDVVESSFWRLRYIFLAAIIYAIFQKIFGYLPHELAWIYSGVGAVREEGFFVTEEVRSFSFFAGVPDLALFSAIMLFFSLQRRSLFFFALSMVGIYLAGSRGIMVSTIIALAVLFFYKRISPRALLWLGFSSAIVAYLLLAVALPATGFLESKNDESRLLIYGTFNYRVTMLLEFLAEINWLNIWFGVGTERVIFDNFFLTLLNDFGVVGLILFLVGMSRAVINTCGVYIAVLVLSYCLYADALFSVYFLFNALLLLNLKPASPLKNGLSA